MAQEDRDPRESYCNVPKGAYLDRIKAKQPFINQNNYYIVPGCEKIECARIAKLWYCEHMEEIKRKQEEFDKELKEEIKKFNEKSKLKKKEKEPKVKHEDNPNFRVLMFKGSEEVSPDELTRRQLSGALTPFKSWYEQQKKISKQSPLPNLLSTASSSPSADIASIKKQENVQKIDKKVEKEEKKEKNTNKAEKPATISKKRDSTTQPPPSDPLPSKRQRKHKNLDEDMLDPSQIQIDEYDSPKTSGGSSFGKK